MEKFNKECDELLEGYGYITTRQRFPSKLKLSEEFIRAAQKEFKAQTAPIALEDDEGNITHQPGRNPKQVLREFQKAFPFILRR